LAFLDILDVDNDDIRQMTATKTRLSGQSEQIVQKGQFKAWLVAPTSAKLLIHGNCRDAQQQQTSELSFFCSTVTQVFRTKSNFVSLVWFCGRHLNDCDLFDEFDSSDYDSDGQDSQKVNVVKNMIKSLVTQLLQQYVFTELHLSPVTFDLAGLEDGDLEQLCALFAWLISQMPEDITVFCLIDGIVYYEREGFEDAMADVVAAILSVMADDRVQAAMKFLVTSPWPTVTVRAGFEDEDGTADFVMSIETLPHAWREPNEARLRRQLCADIGDDGDGDTDNDDDDDNNL
jgi:hypothetical protein